MTRFRDIALGIAALSVAGYATVATIRSSAPTGSQILAGNLYFLTDSNSSPDIYVDTQPVITFDVYGNVTLDTASGANLATDRNEMASNTTNPNQFVASDQNPFSGSGTVSFKILCQNVPNNMTVDVVKSSSATASGVIVLGKDNLNVSSGSQLGSSGATVAVNGGDYLNVITTSGSVTTRQAPDCDLITYWTEF